MATADYRVATSDIERSAMVTVESVDIELEFYGIPLFGHKSFGAPVREALSTPGALRAKADSALIAGQRIVEACWDWNQGSFLLSGGSSLYIFCSDGYADWRIEDAVDYTAWRSRLPSPHVAVMARYVTPTGEAEALDNRHFCFHELVKECVGKEVRRITYVHTTLGIQFLKTGWYVYFLPMKRHDNGEPVLTWDGDRERATADHRVTASNIERSSLVTVESANIELEFYDIPLVGHKFFGEAIWAGLSTPAALRAAEESWLMCPQHVMQACWDWNQVSFLLSGGRSLYIFCKDGYADWRIGDAAAYTELRSRLPSPHVDVVARYVTPTGEAKALDDSHFCVHDLVKACVGKQVVRIGVWRSSLCFQFRPTGWFVFFVPMKRHDNGEPVLLWLEDHG